MINKDTTMTNSTTTMYTEIKFSQFFNQYTPQIIRDNFSNLRGFVNNQDDSIWFIGSEIVLFLSYSCSDPWKPLRIHVSDNNKITINPQLLSRINCPAQTEGRGGARFIILISEQGLYELCTQSELKNSKVIEFRQWIYNAIVNMRQNGVSISDEFRDQVYNMTEDELRSKILQDRSKVDYYDRMIADNIHTISISGIAAELGITPQELNHFLISIGFCKRMGMTSNYITR